MDKQRHFRMMANRYCTHCGHPYPKRCPKCDKIVDRSWHYCHNCSFALRDAIIQVEVPKKQFAGPQEHRPGIVKFNVGLDSIHHEFIKSASKVSEISRSSLIRDIIHKMMAREDIDLDIEEMKTRDKAINMALEIKTADHRKLRKICNDRGFSVAGAVRWMIEQEIKHVNGELDDE